MSNLLDGRRRTRLEVGQRVAPAGFDAPDAIPAFRALRGTVVYVSHDGYYCRVHWDCDGPDAMSRRVESVQVVT